MAIPEAASAAELGHHHDEHASASLLQQQLPRSEDLVQQGDGEGTVSGSARQPTKKKEALSQVPCKFFRASGCSAGDACRFAHILPGEGQGKAICQWYLKGSCRFGHRCALAHILPGQPMSMDRKNKRAAQNQGQTMNGQPGLMRRGMPNMQPFPPSQMPFPNSHAAPFPMMQPMMAMHDMQMPPHNGYGGPFGDFAGPSSGPMAVPPSSSRDDFPFGVPDDLRARPESGRFQHTVQDSSGQDDWSASTQRIERPSAFDDVSGSPARSAAFGTSPFNRPGSQSVFFTGDLTDTAGESGLARSLGRSEDGRPALTPRKSTSGFDRPQEANEGEDLDGEGNDDVKGEDFLPSSLSDLLTPAELERRRKGSLKSATVRLPGANGALPQSVPIRSSLGSRAASYGFGLQESVHRGSPLRRSLLSTSFNVSPDVEQGGSDSLSRSPFDDYQTSEDAAQAFRIGPSSSMVMRSKGTASDADIWTNDSLDDLKAYSPSLQAALSHAPGQSLPRGLAAGLSRLHLRSSDGNLGIRNPPSSTHLRTQSNREGSGHIGAIGEKAMSDDLGPIAPSSLSLWSSSAVRGEALARQRLPGRMPSSLRSESYAERLADGDASDDEAGALNETPRNGAVENAPTPKQQLLSATTNLAPGTPRKPISSPLARPVQLDGDESRGGGEVEEAIFELE